MSQMLCYWKNDKFNDCKIRTLLQPKSKIQWSVVGSQWSECWLGIPLNFVMRHVREIA
jgi:hypothetical protein